MKYQYAYLFTVGTKIVWSGETPHSLLKRASTEDDKDLVRDFILRNTVGSFIELSTGEFVFQIS